VSAGVFGEAWVVLALSIACNLDNLSVGVAYGLARIPIRTVANLAIALVAVVLTAGAARAGWLVSVYVPFWLANDLGAAMIAAVGVWVLAGPGTVPGSIVGRRGADRAVGWRETAVLSVSLSLNNLAAAAGAGMTGHAAAPIAIGLAVGAFSFLAIAAGQRVARAGTALWSPLVCQRLGGAALVALGIVSAIG